MVNPDAAFEDVRLGLRALGSFDGCAVVSDLPWVGEVLQFVRFLMPYPVRVFPPDRRDEAIAWLAGLPGRPSITHRVLPDAGVVVVEVTEPLRVQDIDELATLVDGWLAEHPTLHGLVLHARAFPGWENLSGLVRHLRFVVGTTARSTGSVSPSTAPWRRRPRESRSWSPTRRCAASPSTSCLRPSRGRAPRSGAPAKADPRPRGLRDHARRRHRLARTRGVRVP